MKIHYHPGTTNVVANAISRKVYCNALLLQELQPALLVDVQRLNLGVVEHGSLAALVVQPTLVDQIKPAQQSDAGVNQIKQNVKTDLRISLLADLYLARIVSLHGVPKTIISDRGSLFTSRFWHSL